MDSNAELMNNAERFASSPLQDLTLEPVETLIARDAGCPVVVRGELCVVAGPKKAYKSHVIGKMVAAAIGGKPENCLGFTGVGRPLKVVYLDSEQSAHTFTKLLRKTLLSAGQDPVWPHPDLVAYEGRPWGVTDRRDAIPLILSRYKPDILVVDVITDLVTSFNDYQESAELVASLLRWAVKFRCGIIVSIHLNPTVQKERGHLGTELGNKTYGYVGLARKRGSATVTASCTGCCRGKEFRAFDLTWSAVAGDIITTGQALRMVGEQASSGIPESTNPACPAGLPQDKVDFIRNLFLEKDGWGYGELLRALQDHYHIDKKNRTTARRIIAKAQAMGVIAKGNGKNALYYLVENEEAKLL